MVGENFQINSFEITGKSLITPLPTPMCALGYQPLPPQKDHLIIFAKPSLESVNCPSPPFRQSAIY